jgi:single-strand DNA-binding protein
VSNGLNKVQLIGHLGMDPELRFGQGGGAILRMRLATSESWVKDGAKQERTEWHTVVMFGTRAEALEKHLAKGERIYIEGRLQTRTWEDKDGGKRSATEIIANELLFLGGGKRDGGGERREQHRTTDTRKPENEWRQDTFGDDGDDIPFDRVRMGMCE